jgi:hypothetical protein
MDLLFFFLKPDRTHNALLSGYFSKLIHTKLVSLVMFRLWFLLIYILLSGGDILDALQGNPSHDLCMILITFFYCLGTSRDNNTTC